MKFGIQPCAVIGHSLGEYAALAVAGVLSDSDTVFLVGTRAAILKSKCPAYTHGMVSVRASIANIRHEADGLSFEVACINSPKETVIGGTINCLDVFATRLSQAGCSTTRLDLPHAYHTAQMDDVVDQLILQTQGITYNKPSIPVMSPQDSAIINAGACINPSYLSTSLRRTVDFAGALNAAREAGLVSKATTWLELGHYPVCSGFVSRALSDKGLVCSSLRQNSDDWTSVVEMLSSPY